MILPFSLGVLALALPSWAAPSLETSNVRRAARNYCQPGQACWPSNDDWLRFNSTLNGRLIAVRPWPEPCFGQPRPDPVQCQLVQAQYTNGPARADQPGYAEIDTGNNTDQQRAESAVLYGTRAGARQQARTVAERLNITNVERLDADTRDLSEGADVVVILGQDKAP